MSYFKKGKNKFAWRGNTYNWSVIKTKFSKQNFLKLNQIQKFLDEQKKLKNLTWEKQMEFDMKFNLKINKIQKIIENKLFHPQVLVNDLKKFGIKIYFTITKKESIKNIFTGQIIKNTNLNFEVFGKMRESQIKNDLISDFTQTKTEKQNQFLNHVGLIEKKKENMMDEIIQEIKKENLSKDELETLNYIENNLQEKEQLLIHIFEKTKQNYELCILKQLTLNQKIDLCFMYISDFAEQLVYLLS